MEMYYGSKGVVRYLDVKLDVDEHLESNGGMYQVNMLEANKINGLMDMCVIHTDSDSILRYQTESCYVFSRRFQHMHMGGSTFAEIMTQIGECIDALSLYLLFPENLVLDPEYMLYDVSRRRIRLAYVPGYSKDIRKQIKQLLEFIMRVFDSEDREGIQRLYSMYARLDEETMGASDFSSLLALDEAGEYFEPAVAQPRIQAKDIYNLKSANGEISIKYGDDFDIRNINTIGKVVLLADIIFFVFSLCAYFAGDKGVIWLYCAAAAIVIFAIAFAYFIADKKEDADEAMETYKRYIDVKEQTEIVSMSVPATLEDVSIHSLVPLTNGSLDEIKFENYGDKIVVGRGKQETDYRLPAMEINRVHAYILRKGEEVFVEDLESVNGTYLNSVRIPAKEIKKLNRGDIIGFANEEFFVS